MAAPLNPADQPYKTVLDQLFPEENRGKDVALRTFDLILSDDVEALRAWVSDPSEGTKRVNDVATRMLLHPLHVCAMTGHLECARTLIDTKVCKIDPQDKAGATPLHHAAVRINQAMILLLLKNKASQLPDQYGGTYVSILRQIQEPKPETQTFYFRNEAGKIVKGDGRDFKRLTGATLLDKDCRISPGQWLQVWQGKPAEPTFLPPSLERRYDEFLKKPPLIYLEKHPVAGFNVCAGQDIEPGMVIGEYLGDVCDGDAIKTMVSSADQMEELQRAGEYLYGDIDSTHSRGTISMCNDSFPNAESFDIFNTKGMPVRHVVIAIDRIRKGDPIVFTYGIGHGIRFGNRVELRREEFFNYCRAACSDGFCGLVNRAIEANDGALMKGRLPEAEANLPIQALNYVFSTPSAMLHLLCEGIIDISEVRSLFSPKNAQVLKAIKIWIGTNKFPFSWVRLDHFYQTAFRYFEQLGNLPKSKKMRQLRELSTKIDSSDLAGLISLMGGDPEEYMVHTNQIRLAALTLLHSNPSRKPGDEKENKKDS